VARDSNKGPTATAKKRTQTQLKAKKKEQKHIRQTRREKSLSVLKGQELGRVFRSLSGGDHAVCLQLVFRKGLFVYTNPHPPYNGNAEFFLLFETQKRSGSFSSGGVKDTHKKRS
jgi:hypothetical protein